MAGKSRFRTSESPQLVWKLAGEKPCRKVTFPAVSVAGILAAVGLSLAFGLVGCALSPADTRPRFHEASQASVVLQYNSHDFVFMTSPCYREDGFLQQIRQPDLAGVLDRMNIQRDLAVISLVWQLQGKDLQAVLDDWKALLKQCGFRRVVFVRGRGDAKVEGAIIIEDSDLG